MEDKLQELYFKSLSLYTIQIQEVNLKDQQIMKLMNLKENDLIFLKNIIKAIILPNNLTIPKHYTNLF